MQLYPGEIIIAMQECNSVLGHLAALTNKGRILIACAEIGKANWHDITPRTQDPSTD